MTKPYVQYKRRTKIAALMQKIIDVPRSLRNAPKSKRFVYLAGKINKGSDSTNYRKRIAKLFRDHGLYALDPIRGKYNEERWDRYTDNEVVLRDIQDLKRAHVIFAVIINDGGFSFGTPCEIALSAMMFHVPIVLVTDIPNLYKHFWARAFCSRIFLAKEGELEKTIQEAAMHTIHWYGDDIEDEIYNEPKTL